MARDYRQWVEASRPFRRIAVIYRRTTPAQGPPGDGTVGLPAAGPVRGAGVGGRDTGVVDREKRMEPGVHGGSDDPAIAEPPVSLGDGFCVVLHQDLGGGD
ncbi:MAG: hypothetical protein WB949_15915 [Candidatus Acidiferrales bacterium]